MLRLKRILQVTPSQPPHAIERWQRSLRRNDLFARVKRLRRQLRFAIANAGARPLFLRALGGDIDTELQQLGGRAAFGVGELTSELRERCQMLETTVDHFCDVAAPSQGAYGAIELSDCAREVVAELSGEMRLRLHLQGEGRVSARHSLVTSLFEVAIRSASARIEDEVEVILPSCSGRLAEFRIVWPKSSATDVICTQDEYDRARFYALALAYALKLKGMASRDTKDQEVLTVRIPMAHPSDNRTSPVPTARA